jgi:hypothetical protein
MTPFASSTSGAHVFFFFSLSVIKMFKNGIFLGDGSIRPRGHVPVSGLGQILVLVALMAHNFDFFQNMKRMGAARCAMRAIRIGSDREEEKEKGLAVAAATTTTVAPSLRVSIRALLFAFEHGVDCFPGGLLAKNGGLLD